MRGARDGSSGGGRAACGGRLRSALQARRTATLVPTSGRVMARSATSLGEAVDTARAARLGRRGRRFCASITASVVADSFAHDLRWSSR